MTNRSLHAISIRAADQRERSSAMNHIALFTALYNGIPLAPDIHNLFDAHYLTVDEDYRVVLSPQVREISDTPYYRALHGRKLWLPVHKALWPRQELLSKHRERLVMY
jgi:predicted restriction endonuclease